MGVATWTTLWNWGATGSFSTECLVLCSDTGIYYDLTHFSVKVRLFVCPVTHHIMTAREGTEIQFHAFLPSK